MSNEKQSERPKETTSRREVYRSPLCLMRRGAGFSSTRKAEAAVGLSRQRISQWEQGTFFPADSHAIAMANAYNKTPEEVLRAAVQSWQLGVSHRRYVSVVDALIELGKKSAQFST